MGENSSTLPGSSDFVGESEMKEYKDRERKMWGTTCDRDEKEETTSPREKEDRAWKKESEREIASLDANDVTTKWSCE